MTAELVKNAEVCLCRADSIAYMWWNMDHYILTVIAYFSREKPDLPLNWCSSSNFCCMFHVTLKEYNKNVYVQANIKFELWSYNFSQIKIRKTRVLFHWRRSLPAWAMRYNVS